MAHPYHRHSSGREKELEIEEREYTESHEATWNHEDRHQREIEREREKHRKQLLERELERALYCERKHEQDSDAEVKLRSSFSGEKEQENKQLSSFNGQQEFHDENTIVRQRLSFNGNMREYFFSFFLPTYFALDVEIYVVFFLPDCHLVKGRFKNIHIFYNHGKFNYPVPRQFTRGQETEFLEPVGGQAILFNFPEDAETGDDITVEY